MIILPTFLTRHNKYAYFALGVLIGAALYLSSNHFLIFPAHLLPLTPFDQAVPFIPHTVWIYNSDMFLFLFAYAASKDMSNASKFLYSFLAVLLVSVTVFFLWPTVYPRDLFPLPASLDHWTANHFNHLRNVDAPSNCLPSLHVSISYLAAFIFLDEQREKFPFFMIWATLVALSTLTTKQHYFADVITGLALAIITYFIFRGRVKSPVK